MQNRTPKFYQVGGSIRDHFMGRKSNDIDWVVVGATPEGMLANGYKQVGADFPVFLDSDGVEYALARTERKTGVGYHGFETAYDSNVTLEDDLRRRDLTINAIAYDPATQEYIDPFNGLDDIKNKVLRHVSDSFREDPVRVLRVARFMAQFSPGWGLKVDTINLANEMAKAGELAHLTKERIWKEFEKALNTPNTAAFFETLLVCGALNVVFPLFKKRVAVIFRILNQMDSPELTAQDRFTLIMSLFNPTTVEAFCEQYRIPNDYKEYALFHAKIGRKINMNHYRSPRILIEILNEHGIFRGKQKYLFGPWKAPHLYILQDAYERTRHVSFASLTPEQQATLKGKEIGAAIDALRQQILDTVNP